MGKNKEQKAATEAAAVLDITSKIATLVADAGGDLSELELDGKSSSELEAIHNNLTKGVETKEPGADAGTGDGGTGDDDATGAEAETEATAKKPDVEKPKAEKPRGLPQSREYKKPAGKAPAAKDKDTAPTSATEPTGNTIKNTGINRRSIKCIELAVGGTYELTEDDLEDESLMAKVNRAVELGVLERS